MAGKGASQTITRAQTPEQTLLPEAFEAAKHLFAKFPDGISEGQLIRLLKQKYSLYIAVAAVDQLETRGWAIPDWSARKLVHPPTD